MRPLYRDRNLQLVFGVTLTAIMGVAGLMPALPVMIRDLSIPAPSIGWVITAFTLPGVIMAPVGGILADRLGRKKVLVGSLLLFGLAGGACFFVRSLPALYTLRALQGIGAGPLGVLNATLIGDLFDGRERATAMGYNGGVQALGTALFPALGGLLAHLGWNWPFLMNILALPLALTVALFLENPEPRRGQPFGAYMRSALSRMGTRRALSLFTLTLGTFIILFGAFVTYLPVLLHEQFGAMPVETGCIISLSALATALAASQLGRLSSRFGELSLLRTSFLLYIAALLFMPRLPALWLSALPIMLLGLAQGLNLPSLMTLLSGVAGLENRAAVMAVNGMLLRLGQTVAPLLMGLVFAGFGLSAVFTAAALLALGLLAVAWLALR
ncbi:MFS transporter [Desulfovibrio aminophilus]|uniref:MFS transporter n=1 Tax=Desulfovibrio aminophilus TaxID=81425 RepID=UPI003395666A